MPHSPEQLIFLFLKEKGISFTNHVHVPVFTVHEAQEVEKSIPGAHCKNLFLKTKKDQFVLVVMLGEDRLDLKTFEKVMALGKFSFASAEDLQKYLQITPGSVTPFTLIHPTSKGISVVLDQDMMAFEYVNYHPLRNDMTTTISSKDFLKFFEYVGHQPQILKLPKG